MASDCSEATKKRRGQSFLFDGSPKIVVGHVAVAERHGAQCDVAVQFEMMLADVVQASEILRIVMIGDCSDRGEKTLARSLVCENVR